MKRIVIETEYQAGIVFHPDDTHNIITALERAHRVTGSDAMRILTPEEIKTAFVEESTISGLIPDAVKTIQILDGPTGVITGTTSAPPTFTNEEIKASDPIPF